MVVKEMDEEDMKVNKFEFHCAFLDLMRSQEGIEILKFQEMIKSY